MAFVALPVLVSVAVRTASRNEIRGEELHPALRAFVGLVACDLQVHRAHVCRLFSSLGEQLHAALWAAAGAVADHFGMHRTGEDDRDTFGHAHVHFGDKRERLIGGRVQECLDALA